MRGLLVTFSGLDGAGKSTQIELFMQCLQAQGLKPIYLWIRGGYTPTFNAVKNLLRRFSGSRVVPQPGLSERRTQAFQRRCVRRWWLRLALLDLLWLLGVQVRWWLWRGRVIVCDRFLEDTLIDFRLNFPQERVETWWLWRLLSKVTPQPDAAFLLLIPVEESIRRSRLKNEPFPDPPEVLAERLEQYEKLSHAGHWRVLDGQRPVEELATGIWEDVQAILLGSVSVLP